MYLSWNVSPQSSVNGKKLTRVIYSDKTENSKHKCLEESCKRFAYPKNISRRISKRVSTVIIERLILIQSLEISKTAL